MSVSPGSQGLGLGKAVFANALQLMLRIEGDRDFYLHTQTWSHVAIRIYMKAGFHITREPNLRNRYANDEYDEACAILASVGVKL